MVDSYKTKEQLRAELEEMRERIAQLEALADERKHMEKQILLANERLEHSLSSSPAVIYTAQPSGDYPATFVSKNITQLTGYESHEFVENP